MAESIVDMKPNFVENDNLQIVLIWKLWEAPYSYPHYTLSKCS